MKDDTIKGKIFKIRKALNNIVTIGNILYS